MIEISLNGLALHAPPKKVGPKEFAERRGILSKASRAAQFASERAKRIVDELIYRFRQVTVRSATAIRIKGMRPIAIVHDKPERILIELAEIRNDCDSYLLDTLVMQCTCKMMVINDVMPVLWAKDHGYQVFAEKFFTFLSTFITPMLAFGLNLTHADGNLRWT